jgi:ABC-type sugar transport system substrate-binding protein
MITPFLLCICITFDANYWQRSERFIFPPSIKHNTGKRRNQGGKRMRSALRWISLLVMVMCLILINGCGQRPERKPLTPKLKIIVALSDLCLDGNQIVRKVMEERSKKEDVELTFLDAKSDAREQERQLERILEKRSQRVKTVVIQAVDPTSIYSVIERFKKENIKIVTLETLPQNVPVDGYVASDHSMAGQLQARFVLNVLKGAEGEIIPPVDSRRLPFNAVILKGDPSDLIAEGVVAGIRSVFNEDSRVRVIQEVEHVRGKPESAVITVRQLLAKYNNQIDLILATDSRLAMAGVQALKSAGLNKRVLTLGFGADKEASRALLAGEHDAEVDPMPELLGQYAFDAAVNLAGAAHWQYDTRVLSGDYSVPARIIPVRLIKKTNAYLLEQRWGKEIRSGGFESGEEGKKEQEKGKGGENGQDQEKRQDEGEQGSQEGNGQKKKTRLRITTQEGKKIEMDIPGEIKSIETVEEGQEKQQDTAGTEDIGGE